MEKKRGKKIRVKSKERRMRGIKKRERERLGSDDLGGQPSFSRTHALAKGLPPAGSLG